MTKALLRCWYSGFRRNGVDGGDGAQSTQLRGCPIAMLPVHFLVLLPLSGLFGLLVALRRALYRMGWLKVERLPVPVIVVGNLNVGGSGKTPLTLALVDWLRDAGYVPGIVSRGYGGSAHAPMPVQAQSDPALVGDEPVLLARRAGCPLWIGRKRAEAARQLLLFHPEVNVLIADDGLQHLALARDVELVVVDALRGFGNGHLLPAGPLREPLSRLARADAVVVNGEQALQLPVHCPNFMMRIVGARFVNLVDPELCVSAGHFSGPDVHAIAGIGHPERFFSQLAALGIAATAHAFPDHHAYVEDDLPAGTVLMTEKDAVKCARFARPDLWFLAVDAMVDRGLQPLILNLLNSRKRASYGPQAA